ncbi:MAG TPA: glycosyltransferase family 2 protein [Streptosporangiales bacterium]
MPGTEPRRVPLLAAAVTGFHLVKLAGLLANLALFPALRPGPREPARPVVSLLVPARDEAGRLPGSLPGFLAQPATEILVLDDCSTDATAAIVGDAARTDRRLRLLRGTPTPAGWTGKTWACRQLADAARGELLVFCDADVRLAGGALDAVLGQIRAQRADVFSVFPRQRTGTVGERLLVPLVDEVLLAFLPHPLLRLPVRAAATASGALLAVTSDAYRRIGGHAAVADRVVEDLALARRARGLGLRLGLALGGELVQVRMYRGYADSVRGFGRSLREAHGHRDLVLAGMLAWHLAAYTLPWLLLRHAGAWRAAAAAGLAERLLVNAKTGRRAWAEAALVPVTPLAAVPACLLAFRRTSTWKGRRYPVPGPAR